MPNTRAPFGSKNHIAGLATDRLGDNGRDRAGQRAVDLRDLGAGQQPARLDQPARVRQFGNPCAVHFGRHQRRLERIRRAVCGQRAMRCADIFRPGLGRGRRARARIGLDLVDADRRLERLGVVVARRRNGRR